jgi:hypothetical protein
MDSDNGRGIPAIRPVSFRPTGRNCECARNDAANRDFWVRHGYPAVRLAIWWLLQKEYKKTFCSWIKKAQLKIGFFIVERRAGSKKSTNKKRLWRSAGKR